MKLITPSRIENADERDNFEDQMRLLKDISAKKKPDLILIILPKQKTPLYCTDIFFTLFIF